LRIDSYHLETEIIAERVTAGQAVAKKKGKQWREKAGQKPIFENSSSDSRWSFEITVDFKSKRAVVSPPSRCEFPRDGIL
tara:strand:+ start:5317 stop:5556 length:240 start_codon:yes stop_codon:yes gene_type:complete